MMNQGGGVQGGRACMTRCLVMVDGRRIARQADVNEHQGTEHRDP